MNRFTEMMILLVVIGLFAGSSVGLTFEENYPVGGPYEWEANNWYNGSTYALPTSADRGEIGYGRTCVVDGQTAEADNMEIGTTSPGGTLTVNSGSLRIYEPTGWAIKLGKSFPGTINITGGTMTIDSDYSHGGLQIGQSGATGTVNISGGTLNTDSVSIGYAQDGTMNVSGGVFNASGRVMITHQGTQVTNTLLEISGNADINLTGTAYNDGLNTYSGGTLSIVGSSATIDIANDLWIGGHNDDDPNTVLSFQADSGGVSTINCDELLIAIDSILDLSSDGNTSNGTYTLVSSTSAVTQADLNNFRFSAATDTNKWSNLTVTGSGPYLVQVDYAGGAPTYTLTVNSGTGDGSYEENTVVNISADAPGVGQLFDVWTGDTTNVANVNDPNTTITMPAASTAVTATYVDDPNTFALTVNSGTGDGIYDPNTVVNIYADPPGGGLIFDVWTGDTTNVADTADPNTTITMPSADAGVTATYIADPNAPTTYTLTVNSGTGDGNYDPNTVVNIYADPPGVGWIFDDWTGDTTNVANVNDANTTITMPAANTEVTATYVGDPNATLYKVTVVGGVIRDTGLTDGNFAEGAEVWLRADLPDPNKVFNVWVMTAGPSPDPMNKYKEEERSTAMLTMKDSPCTYESNYVNDPGATMDHFVHGQDDGNGVYLWDNPYNWTLGRIPISGEQTEVGDNWSVVHSTIRNYDVIGVQELEIAEYGMNDPDTGNGCSLTIEGTGSFSATGYLDVGKDKVGYLYMQPGSSVNVGGVLKMGADWRWGRGIVEMDGAYLYAGGGLDVGTQDDPNDEAVGGSTLTATDSNLIFNNNIIILSLNPAAPAEINLKGTTVWDQTGGTECVIDLDAIFNMEDGNLSVTVKNLDFNTPSTVLKLSGTGVSTISALAVTFANGSQLDVSALNVSDGNYTVIDGTSISDSGLQFAAGTDANVWSFSVNTGNGDLILTKGGGGPVTYTLTVNSGTGDGSYTESTVVNIVADPPGGGQLFDVWTGDTTNIDFVNNADANITMPAANTTVTATYVADPNSGTDIYDGPIAAEGDDAEESGIDGSIGTVSSDLEMAQETGGDDQVVGLRFTSVQVKTDATISIAYIQFRVDEADSGSVTLRIRGEAVDSAAAIATTAYELSTRLSANPTTAYVDWSPPDWPTTGVAGPDQQANVASIIQELVNRPGWTPGNDILLFITNETADPNVEENARVATSYFSGFPPIIHVESTGGTGTIGYLLTVNNGTGDGSYDPNTVVNIVADAPSAGDIFDVWTGDTTNIDNVNNADANITMPPASTTVTATYKDDPATYQLTVNSGTGDGFYASSTVVDIDASSAPLGQLFDMWTGDTTNVADIYAASTTITMPAADSEITSTYADDPNFVVPERGYTARPCSFDMDRDGIIGGTGDDDVGDGVTTDPDGDGIDEDILYVDADSGSDSTGDGSAGNPYKTVQYALDQADGPGDGAEDIIAIAGVFQEELTLTQSGVAGYYTRDNFQFPDNPMMLIGWDKDNDGEYPPYDTDDTAVLDGNVDPNTFLGLAITNDPAEKSYVEIAHLSIRNYGYDTLGDSTPRGAMKLAPSNVGTVSHLYFHDVEMQSINDGINTDGYTIIWSFWCGSTPLQNIALINNLIDGTSGYGSRGSPTNGSGYWRVQNNTYNFTLGWYKDEGKPMLGTVWKVWGEHTDVEILYNLINGATSDSSTQIISGGGINVRPCTRNYTIRGNESINCRTAISVDGLSDGGCHDRSIDGIIIDRNIIRNTYTGWNYGPLQGIILKEGGTTTAETIEDVTITNNFISILDTGQVVTGIDSQVGNDGGPESGVITIAGNTIYGPGGGNDYRGISVYSARAYPQEDYVIKNNIFANTGPQNMNTRVSHAPIGWIANGNIYDDDGNFNWDSSPTALITFAEWQTASGGDANSTTGDPVFVDEATGDLHIDPSDTLVEGSGVDITSITTVDYDGDARSSSTPWAGADIGDANGDPNAPPTYSLTVNSGTGDGSYEEDTVVNIDADAPGTGQAFDVWTGDTTNVANVNNPNTTITMPAASTAVTATYVNLLYALTVNDGTGDGNYTYNTVVNIYAADPNAGQQFNVWTGDTSGIANVNDANTTITMPASAANITATYEDIPGPTNDYASSESTTRGTVSGDYTDTQSSNDTYEALTEVVHANRSKLEHEWTFSVTGGSTVTFYVEAYKAGTEDDFDFDYSTDGSNWTNMLTVTKTSDDDNDQSYSLPGNTSGTVYIRVIDTNRVNKAKDLDTVYVDHMFIRSQP